MALQKDMEHNGVTLNYHKAFILGIDDREMSIRVEMRNYVDQSYSLSNKNKNLRRDVRTFDASQIAAVSGKTTKAEMETMTLLELYTAAYGLFMLPDQQERQQVDGNGNLVFAANGDPVMETYEANFYADATAVMES